METEKLQSAINDALKARRVTMGRLWLGTVAFTVGIMGLIMGGLYWSYNPLVYWVVSFGAMLLIGLGLFLVSTC